MPTRRFSILCQWDSGQYPQANGLSSVDFGGALVAR
jgi:hypothetical protein